MTRSVVKKPVVVAVSGWMFGTEAFAPLWRLLERDRNVCAIDGLPAGDACADPALDLALRQNPSCILAGWSLGAQRCLAAALRNPEAPRALVLLAPTARLTADGPSYPGVDPAALLAMRRKAKRDLAACVRDFYAACHRPGAPEAGAMGTAVAEACKRWPGAVSMSGLERLAGTDLRTVLADFRLPVSILHGRADAVVPSSQGAWLARSLPHATLRTFEACGHLPDAAMWQAAAERIRAC